MKILLQGICTRQSMNIFMGTVVCWLLLIIDFITLEYSDTACLIGGAELHLLCNIVSQNVFKQWLLWDSPCNWSERDVYNVRHNADT
jgi:hypothetical protein